jgi:hypothetical protein
MVRGTGKWILHGHPNLHTLIVVAVFVSLATSFLASALTSADSKLLCRELVAAFIVMVGGWIYLPIISECDSVHRAADLKHKAGGKPYPDLVEEELNSTKREERILEMSIRVFASAICLLAAIAVLALRSWG